MNNNYPIIIYGPPGCGKSLNKEKLATLFNRSIIIDNYVQGQTLSDDTIAFTQTRLPGNRSIIYAKAMELYQDWISLCPPIEGGDA